MFRVSGLISLLCTTWRGTTTTGCVHVKTRACPSFDYTTPFGRSEYNFSDTAKDFISRGCRTLRSKYSGINRWMHKTCCMFFGCFLAVCKGFKDFCHPDLETTDTIRTFAALRHTEYVVVLWSTTTVSTSIRRLHTNKNLDDCSNEPCGAWNKALLRTTLSTSSSHRWHHSRARARH